MAHWTSHVTESGTVWRRPLGSTEAGFYWDAVISGTVDAMQHEQIDVAAPHLDIMRTENIQGAWLGVKRRYPLLAAKVIRKADDDVFFEVKEELVHTIPSGELTIGYIESLQDIQTFNEQFQTGPRQLSSEQNVKVFVKSFPQTSQQSDYWMRFHVWLITSHIITDSRANLSLFTTFMTMLTTPSQRLTKENIDQRLAIVPNPEILHKNPRHSVTWLRWRKAIAYAILEVHETRIMGGHTLPGTMTPETIITPAAVRKYGKFLDAEQTKSLLKTCRALGITLGSTYAPLCQIAHARILHRLRGTMSVEEWEYRIRQPMHFVGPFDLRSRMPAEWRRSGGMTEVCNFISRYVTTLPRMPSTNNSNPSYNDLMSRQTFLDRCLSSKSQSDLYLHHPFLHEMSEIRMNKWLKLQRKASKLWEKKQSGGIVDKELSELVTSMGPNLPTFSNYGSSMGSLSEFLPSHFPLRSHSNQSSFLVVREMQIYLRIRPGQIYFLFFELFNRLWLGCWWDGNIYDEHMLREWVDEIISALQHYLGNAKASENRPEPQTHWDTKPTPQARL